MKRQPLPAKFWQVTRKSWICSSLFGHKYTHTYCIRRAGSYLCLLSLEQCGFLVNERRRSWLSFSKRDLHTPVRKIPSAPPPSRVRWLWSMHWLAARPWGRGIIASRSWLQVSQSISNRVPIVPIPTGWQGGYIPLTSRTTVQFWPCILLSSVVVFKMPPKTQELVQFVPYDLQIKKIYD